MRQAAVLAVVVTLLSAGASHAQSARPKPEPPKAPPAPVSLESAAPPYETPLLRLSELLGALTYLRDLCGHGDGGEFRARMAALIDSETAAGTRRDRIAGYFNRGFQEYELLHRTCTPVSREIVRRAMTEAGSLAHDIGNRYGGT